MGVWYSEVNDHDCMYIYLLLCPYALLHAHTPHFSFLYMLHPNAVKSFVEMARFLLKPGTERLSLLSERISQDPLENYFGMQRA